MGCASSDTADGECAATVAKMSGNLSMYAAYRAVFTDGGKFAFAEVMDVKLMFMTATP